MYTSRYILSAKLKAVHVNTLDENWNVAQIVTVGKNIIK